jgi:hypothetical protein
MVLGYAGIRFFTRSDLFWGTEMRARNINSIYIMDVYIKYLEF